MSKKTISIIVIAFTIVIGLIGIFWFRGNKGKSGDLVKPPVVTPTPLPTEGLKTFKFDESTDLKAELEKVNPQVLDADFE